MAERWYKTKLPEWVDSSAESVRQRLDQYILPVLGAQQISTVGGRDIGAMLAPIQQDGKHETASEAVENHVVLHALGLKCEVSGTRRPETASATSGVGQPVHLHDFYRPAFLHHELCNPHPAGDLEGRRPVVDQHDANFTPVTFVDCPGCIEYGN